MSRYRFSTIHVISFTSDGLHGNTVNSENSRFSKKNYTVSLHSHQRSTSIHTLSGAATGRSALVSLIVKCRCGKSVCADERGEFLESSDWCGASVTSGQADSLETPECDETAELLQILRVSQTTPAREAFTDTYIHMTCHLSEEEVKNRYYLEGLFSHV